MPAAIGTARATTTRTATRRRGGRAGGLARRRMYADASRATSIEASAQSGTA